MTGRLNNLQLVIYTLMKGVKVVERVNGETRESRQDTKGHVPWVSP